MHQPSKTKPIGCLKANADEVLLQLAGRREPMLIKQKPC
jgi:hypothetical protein